MLTNSFAAGALAAAYVMVLVLLLNPSLPTAPRALVPLAWSIGTFYTTTCAGMAYVMLLLRQVMGRELFSPAWISVTVLAWLNSVTAAAGAVVFWLNIRTFSLVLEARMITALTQGVIVLTAAALLFLIIALLQRYGGRRGIWAAWLSAVALASIVVPLAIRGRGTPAPPAMHPIAAARDVAATDASRVSVIAIEGGSLELIAAAAAQGRLPNFGRLLDAGAVMHLATLHPTSAEAVWAAIATGKLPQKNGIRSAAVYRRASQPQSAPIQLLPDYCFASALLRYGVLHDERQTATSLQATPLWTVLNRAGISVGLINLPLTQPAPAIDGYVISDGYVRAVHAAARERHGLLVSPPALAAEVEAAVRSVTDDGTLGAVLDNVADRHRVAARADRTYRVIRDTLSASHPTQVSMMRFESADAVGHYFLRYAMPAAFGDVSVAERQRFGGVLEAHYALIDDAIGQVMATLDRDDLLLVMAGFGMEPLGPGKRVLEQLIGDPEVSGSHESAPDGFLMAYGGPVAGSREVRRASIVDVTPTLLYFLGLPVGRDMDGVARVDLFLSSFTGEHPMTFISTYDR